MSLLSMGLEQEKQIGHSASLFEDWLVPEILTGNDTNNADFLSHDDFKYEFDFGFDSNISSHTAKPKRYTQSPPIAVMQNANNAEQAWQAIRNYGESKNFSPSPSHQRVYAPEHHIGVQYSPTLSLDFGSEGSKSPTNADNLTAALEKSSLCPPNSPSLNLLGHQGFQSLSLSVKKPKSRSSSQTRVQKPRSKSVSPSKRTALNEQTARTQRFDRIASKAEEYFNMPSSLHDTAHTMNSITQMAQANHIRQHHAANQSSQVFSSPNSSYVASVVFSNNHMQNSSSYPSRGSTIARSISPASAAKISAILARSRSLEQPAWPASAPSGLPSNMYRTTQAEERYWIPDSGVGAQYAKASSSSSRKQQNPSGLGIQLKASSKPYAPCISPAMLSKPGSEQYYQAYMDGTHPTQFAGPNGLCHSHYPIGQAVLLSASGPFSTSPFSGHVGIPQSSIKRAMSMAHLSYGPGTDSRGIPEMPPFPHHRFPPPLPAAQPVSRSPRSPTSRRNSKSNIAQYPAAPHQAGHRRSKSASSAPGRSIQVEFKNYTPSDSRTLLTGVAPSGSFKTKARREKEAAEKRRLIGEIAKKAVQQAGGDIEALNHEDFQALVSGSVS